MVVADGLGVGVGVSVGRGIKVGLGTYIAEAVAGNAGEALPAHPASKNSMKRRQRECRMAALLGLGWEYINTVGGILIYDLQ
jgi:hypothetical protein